jgi:glycosyltransferase involved in cell wall biosynthesis
MKVSVIIPTYQPQDYLWECLDSLVAQTFPKEDFEVVLVLNGCGEPYKSRIEEFVSQRMAGMHVNFIHTETGGVSNARNLALDHAKGDFVTFIDDDDYVSPKYLELLYEKADADTISVCMPYAFKDGDVSTPVSYPIRDVVEEMYEQEVVRISSKVRKCFSGCWMKLIPRNYIQDRRFDVRFKNGEDALFMFLISNKFNKISFANKEAIYYRRYRENSAVTRKRKRSEVVKTGLLQMGMYLAYFLRRPFSYNLNFFLTRFLAAAHGIVVNVR